MERGKRKEESGKWKEESGKRKVESGFGRGCVQGSREFSVGVLVLFVAAGCLGRLGGRADGRAVYSSENVEKDSSVHADGVYDYDEECLRRKKDGHSHVTSLFA